MPTDTTDAHAFAEYESLSACPVCSSESFRILFKPDVAQCARCLVYFRNPRPTQDEIRKSYDFGSNYAQWQTDETMRGLMWKRRFDHLACFKRGGKLLDVGAGDGYFLDVAKSGGFQTYGTELSSTGADYAGKRGHHLLLGQLKDIDFKDLKFDAITLWHVLEHLPNPGEALSIVYNLLQPGGIFAVAVPNEENQLFRHRTGVKKSDNPLGPIVWGKEIHLTHFQPETLRAALRDHGFQVKAFGVDDIYWDRSAKNMAKLAMQKSLSAALGWHFSMAMYCICSREA